MKKEWCVWIAAIFFPSALYCQMITGKIKDASGAPLANANVLLLQRQDSSVSKATISSQEGKFQLKDLLKGSYFLTVSSTGYETYGQPIEVGEQSPFLLITLLHKTTSLQEVQVTGKKPFIEQRMDRMIVNVSNSIVSSGSTALEILQKTPTVTVDMQNDLLKLKGKQGVIIQIDGKPTYLPADQVVAMLRNMPGSNIDRIELITNPSARYDAAGNAGIIDIRLKKNNNAGTNGSIALSGGSGKYDRTRSSFQINHKTKRFNLFSNYAFNRGGDFWNFRFNRIIADGAENNYIDQTSPINMRNRGHNAKAGIDFQAGPSTNMGIVWTGIWNKRKEDGTARTAFRDRPDGNIYLQTLTDKHILNNTSNQLGSFYVQHNISNNGGQLTGNIDVGRYSRRFNNSLATVTLIPADPPSPQMDLLSVMPVGIDILTFTADYNKSYKKGWSLQTGWKSSDVNSDNNMQLSQGEKGHLIYDSALSNDFRYKEQIHAAYISASGKIDSITEIQFGVRAEHTISDANSITQKKQVKRNYLNIFPSFFISRQLNEKNVLVFSYSYRINRPTYPNLNPVRSYLDPYAYFRGNAFLTPDYTHSVEVKHSFNGKISTSLGASYTKDLILFILTPVDGKTSERTPENMGKAANYDLTVTAPVTVMKGWNIQWTAIGTYGNYRYKYLDSSFKTKQISGRLNAINSFIFGQGWTAELSGWVNTPTVESIWKSPWLASADIGIQKTLNRSFKLKFSVSDIFHSDLVKARISTPKFTNDVHIRFDTRVALLNITYSFGNQQLKMRQRKTSSEDELKRLN